MVVSPVAVDPRLATLAAGLLNDVPSLAERAFRAIVAEDAEYAALAESLRAEVLMHNARNLRGLLEALAGTTPIRVDVPRETARRRAEQGVPLGTVLHAYRIGFRVLWEALVDRAAADPAVPAERLTRSVSAVWSMIDIYSEAVTDAYRETLIELARHDERRRLVLMDALIDGRLTASAEFGGNEDALGLPRQGPYLCVNADPGDPPFEQVLRRHGVRSVWRPRPDALIGVVAVPAHYDARQIRAALTEAATARAGLSPQYQELRETPSAVRLAGIARAARSQESSGTATIDDDPVATLVAASPQLAAALADAVLGPVLARPDRASLLEVLEARVTGTESVAETAARLYCHRNTVHNRQAKLEECTGRSLDRPGDAAVLYAALCAHRLPDRGNPNPDHPETSSRPAG